VLDYFLSEIPFVGLFTGYMFHPSYTLYRVVDEQPLFRMTKQPAFFESKFTIEDLSGKVGGTDEIRALLGMMMAVQLERSRG
jgi:hypothetical protein